MLSEEALVLLAVLGACGLLVLGILEVLWPTQPRLRLPRRAPRPVARPAAAPAGAMTEPSEAAVVPPAPLLVFDPASAVEPGPAPLPAPTATIAPVAAAAGAPGAGADGLELEEAPAVVQPAEERDAARSEPAPAGLLDRCLALYQEGRFAEVIAEGRAELEAAQAGAGGLPGADGARLWGLVGLAKQAVGDDDGARAALEEALAAAPAEDRPIWAGHLAELSLGVGQRLCAHAAGDTVDADERVDALRAAITWLAGGLAAVPDDPRLREALDAARNALWPTYETAVATLVQRQEFHAARRLLRDALADEDLPAARQAVFRDLLSAAFSGEVGQLSAEAMRSIDTDEEEALGALERAENLLAMIPGEALTAPRRQELERRLWWGYTKLGMRRAEAGAFEAALEPLFRALAFPEVGAERQHQARGTLVRALESLAETRAEAIARRAKGGDVQGAGLEAEKLWAFLRSSIERGLAEADLAGAFRTVEALAARLRPPAS
jgi:hypothetical protein